MATDAAAALAEFAKKKADAEKARADEQKALDAEQKKLIDAVRVQHAALGLLLAAQGSTGSVPAGAATSPSFHGGAPLTGRVTGSAWSLLGAPAVSAIVWPEPQTDPVTAALTDTIPDPNTERYNDYLKDFEEMQVPTCTVTVKNGVVKIEFGVGRKPVDAEDMWKRMNIRPNKTKTANGFVYELKMSVETAARYGKTVQEIKKAFLAHLALNFSRTAKNGNTQRYSVTPMFMAHHAPKLPLSDTERTFLKSDDMFDGTARFMADFLSNRGKPRQPQYRSGGGGGGGSAAPPELNTRSIKAKGQGETGAEFVPTGPLAVRIKDCRPPITGAQPKDPAGYKSLGDALKKNKLAYNKTTNSFSSSDTTVTEETIEKIICTVFKLQTRAEIADANREAAQRAFQAKQAETLAAQNAGIGGGGAFEVLADDVDKAAEDAEDAAAEDADNVDAAAVEAAAEDAAAEDTEADDLVDTATLPKNVLDLLKQVEHKSNDKLKEIYEKACNQFSITFDGSDDYQNTDGTEINNEKEIAKMIGVLAFEVIYE